MNPNGRPRRDLTSQVFGRLTVTRLSSITSYKNVRWECKCSCGNIVVIARSHLVDGNTKSCGCLREDLRLNAKPGFIHGHACRPKRTSTYGSWMRMKSRCNNPHADNYRYYGARGITVCERWKIFSNFLSDMGERPKGKSLDRYPDPDGNYEKANCRWATPLEQRHNRSRKSSQTQSALKAPETASTPL